MYRANTRLLEARAIYLATPESGHASIGGVMRRALVLLLRVDRSPPGSFTGLLSSISNIAGDLRSPCRVGRNRSLCGYAVDQFSDDEYECEFEDHKVGGFSLPNFQRPSLVYKFVSLINGYFNYSLLLRWRILTNGGGNLTCCCEMLRSKRLSREIREIGEIMNKSLTSLDEWVCIGNLALFYFIVCDVSFFNFLLV